ncbi:MAG TPA: NRDE family protein [Bacillales bacterium]|nr:NRDE family protein [Bacillales bacterium]
MCLIAFAYDVHPNYKLIMAANRDEYYHRPTKPAHFWQEDVNVLAGKDLEKMGTWMGITKSGRFAAVTNYREPGKRMSDKKSRGDLVRRYLCGKEHPKCYMSRIAGESGCYEGFNLICGDQQSVFYYSNRGGPPIALKSGVYGLSNALLDDPWPKVTLVKQQLRRCLRNDTVTHDQLQKIMANAEPARDEQLPETGVGAKIEKLLSPVFIKSETYGTRSTTTLLVKTDGSVDFMENVHVPENQSKQFAFQIGEEPSLWDSNRE